MWKLVGDRFICEASGGSERAFDLATGRRVWLEERLAPDARTMRRWLDGCARLMGVWHSRLIPMVDAVVLEAERLVVAYPHLPERPTLTASTEAELTDILRGLTRFLWTEGMAIGAAARDRAHLVDGAIFIQPGGGMGEALSDEESAEEGSAEEGSEKERSARAGPVHAEDDVQRMGGDGDAGDGARRAERRVRIRERPRPAPKARPGPRPKPARTAGSGSHAGAVGVRLAVPEALSAMMAALECQRPGEIASLFVGAARGAGFSTLLLQAAREIRRMGMVPVSVAVWRQWPEVARLLAGRTVVLLADRRDTPDEWGREVRAAICACAASRTRLAGVLAHARPDERHATVALPAMGYADLASRLWLRRSDGRLRRRSRVMAIVRRAEGLPGVAIHRLLAMSGAARTDGATTMMAALADFRSNATPPEDVRGTGHEALAAVADRREPARTEDAIRSGGSARIWRHRSRAGAAWGQAAELEIASFAKNGRTQAQALPSSTGPSKARGAVIPSRTLRRRELSGEARNEPSVLGPQAEALVRRRRWAAAVRGLRRDYAAHMRRGDAAAAARSAMALGRLRLSLADVPSATRWFGEAVSQAVAAGADDVAAHGAAWLGLARLDGAEMEESELLLRASLIVARHAGDAALARWVALGLARCLYWQGRFAEVHALTERHGAAQGTSATATPDVTDVADAANAVDTAGVASPARVAGAADAAAHEAPADAHSDRESGTDAKNGAAAAARAGSIDARAAAARLAVRTRIVRGQLGQAATRLREAARHVDASRDADVASAIDGEAARLHLLIGDLDACDRYLRDGLARPLVRARQLRLYLVLYARLMRDSSAAARRRRERLAATLLQPDTPRLLRIRARYWIEGLSRPSIELHSFVHRYGSAALAGGDPPAGGEPMWDDLQNLLQICHDAPDEREAAARVCACVRERLSAARVAVHLVSSDPETMGDGLLVWAGSARLGSGDLARRVIETRVMAPVSPTTDAVEAGVPVRRGATLLGVIVARWPVGARPDERTVTTVLMTAAAVIAPLLQALQDRFGETVAIPADTAGGTPVPGLANLTGLAGATGVGSLLGSSAVMVALRETVRRVAAAPFPVLIHGESGSGKELVARALHHHSPRRTRRFCAVNCAALTEELFEAEMFGHTRGAFTGALVERQGLFEEADGGTLFLDEVGELSGRGQAKLLRVMQDGEVRRVGENLPRRVDARIVAATNRILKEEVGRGAFRADLLYRLDVIHLDVPPLRERREDIPLLVRAFWEDAARKVGSRATLASDTVAALARYDWPGNVRELQNTLMSLTAQVPSRGRVQAGALSGALPGRGQTDEERAAAPVSFVRARRAFEARLVRAALLRSGGAPVRAARELGLTRQGLAKVMARLGIEAGEHGRGG